MEGEGKEAIMIKKHPEDKKIKNRVLAYNKWESEYNIS